MVEHNGIQRAKAEARKAIKFAEWCRDNYIKEGNWYNDTSTNNWESRSEQRIFTTRELWNIFSVKYANLSKCSRCENKVTYAVETCPYAEHIGGDGNGNIHCNCCSECKNQCKKLLYSLSNDNCS